MRDFRFRAFYRGKMYYFLEITQYVGEPASVNLLSVNRGYHGAFSPGDEAVLMQATGIADRDGRDIYEGDILATANDDPAYDLWTKEDMGYSAVRWSAELCRFVGTAWQWDGWKPSEEPESIYDLAFVRVIGNVHEHPDLLAATVRPAPPTRQERE